MAPPASHEIPPQPLFETPGTDREAQSSDSSQRPQIENILDTAVKHVVPENPAPKAGEEKSQDVEHERGAEELDQKEDEEDEQKPLMAGTPLDELRTPMFEESKQLGFNPAQQGNTGRLDPVREVSSDSLASIPPPQQGLEVPRIQTEQSSTDSMDLATARPSPVEQAAFDKGGDIAARPGLRGMGSVRMGASALMSALNALPWEDDEGDSSGSDEEESERPSGRMGQSVVAQPRQRPKVTRLHSSLHTIRPRSPPQPHPQVPVNTPMAHTHHGQNLDFPFRENTIARRAQSPGVEELNYQFSQSKISATGEGGVPVPRGFNPDIRRDSDQSLGGGILMEGEARQMVDEQIRHEENLGEEEEEEEMERAAEEGIDLTPEMKRMNMASGVETRPSDDNVGAALREGQQEEAMEGMASNAQEKKRMRRELLAGKLQEVFGLEEREEVLEEMRCWLLRSVMLKGYMYLTTRHICFFAHMPNRDNLVVKTGALQKKASRTKLNTKFWVVLRNEVLSWYESAADPYFPHGSVSLQYASSCDAINDTKFKLRTSERNYTFTADTETARDDWMKAIQKVMFKTQHEGENVKLIIPLEVVLDLDKSPTLEFAETIEIKCVDPEDQMSVDSYFFASFQDSDRAYNSIQKRLDERPSHELPQVSSMTSMQSQESLQPSARRGSDASTSASPGLGLKKLGSVLKPFISRSSVDTDAEPEHKKGISVPFMPRKHKPSHDSLETLREDTVSHSDDSTLHEDLDGYPPRQTGAPPSGMDDENNKKGAFDWIKKPAKLFGSSPSQSSVQGRSPPSEYGITDTPTRTRTGRTKHESVTEVVEPALGSAREDHDSDDSEYDENERDHHGRSRNDYSMMEQSESGNREDLETARKFRSVFSLGDKEELIDHFPGYLYRVLPVSGRFFVSTNYLCFRSSQLLYKTKMMVPIRDLYGLKAQKAFRFGHSGLIVVIKGHEEIFLEFSSAKRRRACVALLEQRMEEVRQQAEGGPSDVVEIDAQKLETRIMEDLDESTPVEPKTPGVASGMEPSQMFGSTTSTMLDFKPEPMRITCLTIGSRGDVQPYIALCKGLQAEGHRTRIATHGEYKEWVEGHGIEFASVGGDPAELMQMCVDNGMFTVSFLKEGMQKFRGWLDDLLNSSWTACQESDLLIESPSAMGGIHIAEALQIPYFRAFTMPWTRTRAYPHAFAVPEHKKGGAYNYMTYTMFDQVFWRATSGQINRWRKNVMGIDATNFDKLEQHKVPFLYNFSPSVVPPPLDWTEWIHVTGYWFLENADESASKDKEWSPPEGLLEFIDKAHKNGKKVVYIGFGSIVVSDPEEMTRCVVDAVVDSGVCAILSKGWSDRGSKAKGEDKGDKDGADGVKYPEEIFSIDSIDHSWLFPRIDAACHHGGAGTSGASLRAGIPTIIKPFFGDQAFWSERVESLNVGSAVRKLTSETLAEALRKATTDEKQVAKAKIVGEMIRRENGVSKAIESIYRDLEYAKSIVKPLPPLEKSSTTSSLLHPLTSRGDGSSFGRSRSMSSPKTGESRPLSPPMSEKEHLDGSDESWSVVSDAEEGNGEGHGHKTSGMFNLGKILG